MIEALNNQNLLINYNNYKPEPFITNSGSNILNETENINNSYYLGNGNINNLLLSAKYYNNSSVNCPIITVTINSNNTTEEINININSINPDNATEAEIFAYCKYIESKLPDSPMFFAAYDKLNQFRNIAENENIFNTPYTITDCLNTKKNWTSMINSVNKLYMKNGDYSNFINGKKLEGIFSGDIGKCSEKYSFSNNELDDNPLVIEEIGLINLNEAVDIEISSTRQITCIDYNNNHKILWSRSCSVEEFEQLKSFPYNMEILKPYMSDIRFWNSYFDGSLDLDKLDNFNKLVEDKSKNDDFIKNCTNEVKEAWNIAKNMTGTDPLGLYVNGEIEYFSEYLKQMLVNYLLGTDTNVLGTTKEEALNFAKSAVEFINNMEKDTISSSYKEFKTNEKNFWKKFISYLE